MRAIRPVATVAALTLCALSLGWPPALAATELHVTTPYPAVAVAAGESVTFPLEVVAPGRQRVDLSVSEVPRGWSAVLRGGGFLIDGVYTDPDGPPEVDLEISIPEDARQGRHGIVVTGVSETSGSDTLVLVVQVSRVEAGQVSLTAEFPRLQGPAGSTFEFALTLENETPRETVFDLEAAGPSGWQVRVVPSSEELASSVKVGGGQSEGLTVEVDPPDQAVAGAYPIGVRATGGGMSAVAELTVEITGSFGLTLTTPDERLNADVSAGDSTDLQLVLVNDGTAPLREVGLEATSPSGWEVTFRPETVAEIPPGESVSVTARITPADEAVAGDYVVTLRADTPEVSDEIELRATVRTSGMWGLVGVGLIAAALGGLAAVFRRYGRR